jgi:2-polyprenyl-3-methyl-5-hydroxy-6-metoxy-1,4-benzoquinol methylase
MASRFVSRSCPVCEANESAKLFTKGALTVVRCTACSMVFANPIDEELISGVYYDQLANPFYLSPDKLQSDYATVRFERELKLFRKFCPRGAALDVGCSTGAFLFQVKQRFGNDYAVTGIDVSGPALAHAEQQGITVIREPFLTADFKEQRFSAVTFWAVLEHLAQPGDFLARTASLLETGGVCFILVPNFQSLATRLLGKKYRYIFPQHVNYFTVRTLKQLVATRPEFQVVHVGSTHFNPLVIFQDWRKPRDFVPDEERAKLLKRTTAYKQNPAMKPVKGAIALIEKSLGALTLADNITMVLRKVPK